MTPTDTISPREPETVEADYKSMQSGGFLQAVGMDAMKWADAFEQINPPTDHGTMLGWFANAIMAGYDEAQRRAKTEIDQLLAEREKDKAEIAAQKDLLAEIGNIANAIRARDGAPEGYAHEYFYELVDRLHKAVDGSCLQYSWKTCADHQAQLAAKDKLLAMAWDGLLLAARWFKLNLDDETSHQYPPSKIDLASMFDAMNEARIALTQEPAAQQDAGTPAGWNSMKTAPHTGKRIQLLNDDYSIVEDVFWGQRELPSGELVLCWISIPDQHAYIAGEYRFIGWRHRQQDTGSGEKHAIEGQTP